MQKRQTQMKMHDLAEECAKFKAMVIFVIKDSTSYVPNMNTLVGSLSIDFKEEEIVHRLQEGMEINK